MVAEKEWRIIFLLIYIGGTRDSPNGCNLVSTFQFLARLASWYVEDPSWYVEDPLYLPTKIVKNLKPTSVESPNPPLGQKAIYPPSGTTSGEHHTHESSVTPEAHEGGQHRMLSPEEMC